MKQKTCHRCKAPIDEPALNIHGIEYCERCALSFEHWNTHYDRRMLPEEKGAFYRWACENYPQSLTPESDFVGDMKLDEEFPMVNDFDTLYGYLERYGASHDALKAFVAVWERWEYEVQNGLIH